MVRVPVPDDYDRGHISVAGSDDSNYGEADVNLEGKDRARDLAVTEDSDGRYVGTPDYLAEHVAEYLGVDAPESGAETTAETEGDGSDGGETDESDADGDETPTCAGGDGSCSREVDEPGDKCWQHAED